MSPLTHTRGPTVAGWRRRLVAAGLAAGLAAGGLAAGSPAAAASAPEADFLVVHCTQPFPKSNFSWCQLDGSVSTGDIVEWTWQFGDGDEVSRSQPTIFAQIFFPGKNVTLTVTTSDNQSDATTKFVTPSATS